MGATSNEGTGVGSVEKSFSRIKNNIKKENFAPNAFGHISFDGVKIQGGENNSGDGNGFGTIELVPDKDLYENDQYLIIDPTAPNHIHIRAGGDVDNSNAVLTIGGENSNFQINSGEDPSVVVRSAENIWNFSSDGALVFPDMTSQTTAFSLNEYRGFYAKVNRIYGDDPSINQIVLSTSAFSSGKNATDNTNNDDFYVEGLGGGSTIAIVNLYGNNNDYPIDLDYIKLFIMKYIDLVLFDGVNLRTNLIDIAQAFDDNYTTLVDTMPEATLYSNFEFYGFEGLIDVTGMGGSGSGAKFWIDAQRGDYGNNSILCVGGSGYSISDTIIIDGSTLGGSTPENDVTILVGALDSNGGIAGYDISGSGSLSVYPNYYIDDGDDDQYDIGNFLGTNLTMAEFVGSVGSTGRVLTVTSVLSGTLDIGKWIYFPDIDGGAYIQCQQSGTQGQAGVYILNDYTAGQLENYPSSTLFANGMTYSMYQASSDEAFGTGSTRISMYGDSIFSMVAINAENTYTFYYNGETGSDGDGGKEVNTINFGILLSELNNLGHKVELTTDGVLKVPKIQITATAPDHSYGVEGDKKGMIAIDQYYVYFCMADWNPSNTSDDIWRRFAYSPDAW